MPLNQTTNQDGLGGDIIAGEGVAGTPAGGVLTVQGASTATPIPVTMHTPLTPSAAAAVSAGVSSGSLVAANTSRKGLVITNVSANNVSLNLLGGTAVLNQGITLYPGWIWEMDSFTFTTNAITVIASAASSSVAVQEFS